MATGSPFWELRQVGIEQSLETCPGHCVLQVKPNNDGVNFELDRKKAEKWLKTIVDALEPGRLDSGGEIAPLI